MDFEELSALVQSDEAKRYVRRYFGVDLNTDKLPQFTGGRFELLAGGGDQPCVQDEFTPADILAVELLSIRVPGKATIDLLEGSLGREAAKYLRQIPAEVPVWADDADSLIVKGSPAYDLWRLLKTPTGIGPVTSGKLLARKRPALIPIYDSIVGNALDIPHGHFWSGVRDLLRRDNGRLLNEVTVLKEASKIPDAITELRVLDVVVWMHHNPRVTSGQTGL